MSSAACPARPLAPRLHEICVAVPVHNKPSPTIVRYRVYNAVGFPGWIVLMTEHVSNKGTPVGMAICTCARYALLRFPEMAPRRVVFIEHSRRAMPPSAQMGSHRILELSPEAQPLGRDEFELIGFTNAEELLLADERTVEAIAPVARDITKDEVEDLIGGSL